MAVGSLQDVCVRVCMCARAAHLYPVGVAREQVLVQTLRLVKVAHVVVRRRRRARHPVGAREQLGYGGEGKGGEGKASAGGAVRAHEG